MSGGRVQWEYKTLLIKPGGFLGGKIDQSELDGSLESLGREGWELVTVLGASAYEGSSRNIVLIFKRVR